MGFSCVLLGVTYVNSFFLQYQEQSLLPQLVVGLLSWIWISLSTTVFWIKARNKEINILDGVDTQISPRNKWVVLYFTLSLLSGVLLALVCLGTNTFRIVVILAKNQFQSLEFALMIIAWPAFIFYAGLLMDATLIYLRNHKEDESVCCRLDLFLKNNFFVVILF